MIETQMLEKNITYVSKLEQEIVIKSEADCEKANVVLKNIKEMIKKVKETFDPIITKAHSAHKEAVAQRDKYVKPLESCEKAFKIRIAGYLEEQDRIRQRLQQEAEEKARKEAEKLQARAEKAEAKGNTEKADELRQEAEIKQSIVPEIPKARKPEGFSVRKVWKGKIVDESLIPREYLIVDESKINKVMNATAGEMKIPGVQAYQEIIPMSR